jgi:hypothetical protein
MINNKRGDIPITILVVGVVLICTIALVSFISSSISVRKSFTGIAIVEQLDSQIEENAFYTSVSPGAELPNGTYLEKEITKGFLWWAKKIVSFSVKYHP